MDQQPVEQAIFTSTDTAAGDYRIVASSFGIGEADSMELAAWGPTPDSMIESDPAINSFNFHPLPSGAHCLSRTAIDNGEPYSGARRRVYTHCLVVPPETLARFGNNPFALIRTAALQELWRNDVPSDPALDPLCFSGGAAVVDEALLIRLAENPGAEQVAAMVQEARGSECMAVGGAPSPVALIAGVFSCLPAELRLEYSFTTGLKFSRLRPFRLIALSDDPAERHWVAGYSNVTVMELTAGEESRSVALDDWGQLIRRALETGNIPFLSAQLSKRRFDLTAADLPVLGLQLQEELDALELGARRPVAEAALSTPAARQAHAAHQRFAHKESSARNVAKTSHSVGLAIDSPEMLEKLERLDDLVYESINGQPGAFGQLQTAWPKLLDELGEEAVAESREQYLRYALSIWDECAESDGIRHSDRALQALDVLCLLFGETAQ